MAFFLSPLVSFTETDLTTSIGVVSTSIACIALRETWKGPEDQTTFISTSEELLDTFGNPTNDSYKDMFSALGFLKYGNKLYCTRCMPTGSTFAGAYGPIEAQGTLTAYTSASSGAYTLSDFTESDTSYYGDETVVFGADREDGSAMISIIAASRGAWGNYIKVAVVGKDTYTTVSSGGSATGMSSDLRADVLRIDAPLDTNQEFLVIVRAADQEDVNETTVPYEIKEYFVVSTNPKKVNDENKNIFCENVINQESQYIRISLNTTKESESINDIYMTDYVNLGGGINSAFADQSAEDTVVSNAYDLYKNSDFIDINIFIDSDKSTTIKRELNDHCETNRKDSIALLDCQKSDVVDNLGSETDSLRIFSTQTLNINSSYSTLYGNWLEVFDKWASKYRWIPASGYVAGIYANTDETTDPWFAPAGLNRAIITNVRRLAWNPSLGDRDILYKNRINPLVAFAGLGKVVWGQKTLLNKSSAFSRVNIRRLFTTLEKALVTDLKYFLFEPNDGYTRLQIVNTLEPFLRDVKGRRGIDDFEVVCDTRNNTPERIQRNELWVDVFVKPVLATEYIQLNMIATRSDAVFSEIILPA